MRKNLIIFAAIFAMLIHSFLIGRREGVKATDKWYKDNMDTTTVVQIDTNKHEAPIPDTVYRDKFIPYPVYVPGETPAPEVIVKDSIVYMMLPKEIKEYRTEDYFAKVSGVSPSLDYIETYNKTITNTVYVPQKPKTRYDFFELDAKFLYDGAPMAPVTANIGYRRGLFEVYAGGGYDFLLKRPVGQVGLRGTISW